MFGRVACWRSVSCAFFLLSAQRKIFLAISRTECCSKPDLFLYSLPHLDSFPAWEQSRRHRGPVYFCCNGNGFESTSSQVSRRSSAETPNGATLQPWTSTIRTVHFPHGSAGAHDRLRVGSFLDLLFG